MGVAMSVLLCVLLFGPVALLASWGAVAWGDRMDRKRDDQDHE